MKYKLFRAKIWIKYHLIYLKIRTHKYIKYAQAYIAAGLFWAAKKVSPDFVETYDRLVIEKYTHEYDWPLK